MTSPDSSPLSTTPDKPSPCSPDSACSSCCSPSTGLSDAPPARIVSVRVTTKPDALANAYSDVMSWTTPLTRSLTPHKDNRGNVRETFRASWFPMVPPIVQMVRSKSKPRTIRAMHRHLVQWDIWHFVSGFALVRTYDHRTGTDFYQWAGPDRVIAIPPGMSHGFYSPDGCTLLYGLTQEYDGSDEYGWHFSDGVDLSQEWADEWPTDPTGLNISTRDLSAPRLAEFGA